MKDLFLIKGQNGKKALCGTLSVHGAKNAALPAFASAILFKDKVRFENVPYIDDIRSMQELIENLGGETEREAAAGWEINAAKLGKTELDHALAKHMRASIILTGPILGRYGEVSFPHPGGCVLGERPLDMFIDAFKKMGATLKQDADVYRLSTNGKKLRGAEIFLHVSSHTATETIMMAAILAEGKTVIKNAAMEPEIASLADFLISCGAKISGAGTPTIEITGNGLLSCGKKTYRTIPDRIEAGSFLILAALAGENLSITDCEPAHIESLIDSLTHAGVPLKISKDSIMVTTSTGAKNSEFKAVNVKTHEYPGFPTDLQAPMTVFLTQVTGESNVFETIFDGRLNYADDLIKMGAKLSVWSKHTMTVKGPTVLKGRELDGPDIRAGLAYILAAIVAKGRSVINNVHYIDRGYERIEERLKAVGVDIERVSN
ncbi:MAG: UDP-N-acetylglucosamine 1-carboxyvinyltransferase [Candidatus Magasanikbacteria bacterium GW2011_GWA2_46_17]|uniref:UDP-N-acetylglucosamine 1-carboxyvinyltransferase n=1 Tax=Candidatus Magasanikbacteria bacterium GW2011_GWA2_46_17 TaxID=1619042 RepID=A0A0G1NZL6_9BACT|nr:MAG: UDP-N-acetylglucosamine 1-carboxyvinyltransferase [Candidatus Magasanikbacteria bacterium GW2011_GWA2_46_17]